MRGKEFIEYDNPFDVGMSGLLGFSSGYHAMMTCELLLLLGTDFPYQQFFPKAATIIQIDLRGEQLGRRTKLDFGFVGDVRATLRALLPRLKQNEDDGQLSASREHYRAAREGPRWPGLGRLSRAASRSIRNTSPAVIDELAADDAIFSCDVGTPTIWAARYLTMNGQRRLLGSFNHGSMANALPQAIGAQVSHPGRQVVTLSGDGGVAMLLGDLLSLRQLADAAGPRIRCLPQRRPRLRGIGDEGRRHSRVRHGSAQSGFRPDGRSGRSPGIEGARPPERVRPMPQHQALQHDGPALVEVHVSRQELSMPPTISLAQARGFGLFMLKAVLSGRGSEIIDLAKVNLLR